VAFKDVAGYWAEEAVNEMGSRLVVSGIGEDLYNLNQASRVCGDYGTGNGA